MAKPILNEPKLITAQHAGRCERVGGEGRGGEGRGREETTPITDLGQGMEGPP